MPSGYRAHILLDAPWHPDTAALAELIAERFAEIGPVAPAALEAEDGGCLPALSIDGATVAVVPHPTPAEVPREAHGLRPLRRWDPGAAIAGHTAHLAVHAAGPGEGLLWAKAYATAVTVVAGTLARHAPAVAVLFPASGVILPPLEAARAARMAAQGVSPIEAWVAVFPVTPTNAPIPGHHGALTRGLEPFLGAEIEVAPLPLEPRRAVERAEGAAWQALDAGASLADGERFAGAPSGGPEPGTDAEVRRAAEWLRPGVPAFVLVGEGSCIDAATLRLRPPAAAPLSLAGLAATLAGGPADAALLARFRGAAAGALPALGRSLAAARPHLADAVRRLGPGFRRAAAAGATAAVAARHAVARGIRRVRQPARQSRQAPEDA